MPRTTPRSVWTRSKAKVFRAGGRGAQTTQRVRARGEDDDNDASDGGELKRVMEDELKDPNNFVDYLLPRGVRKVLTGASAAGCLLGTFLAAARLLSVPTGLVESGDVKNLAINFAALVVFVALFLWDNSAEQKRVEDRERIREAQITRGDREVFTTADGDTRSKLKPVDDEWIIRRLDRWGKSQDMPFLGPTKAQLLAELIDECEPRTLLEVGTLAGYSAIVMSQAAGEDARVISIEKDWLWVLVAKRFLWQANGEDGRRADGKPRVGERVTVEWGDALSVLPRLAQSGVRADVLLLDGVPSEYLAYLKAAEPLLAPGARIVADNVGVFESTTADYLEYVRGSEQYTSQLVECPFGYRPDVADAMEVSVFQPRE